MSKFLTGKELEDAIYDIIWETKKALIIVSPFIKLDDYFKNLFNKHEKNPNIHLLIVFGKNEKAVKKSMSKADFDYFKKFPNVSIIHVPNLHAKYYGNEKKGIITSINLYDYSFKNNIEFGVFSKQNSLINFNNSTDNEAWNECFYIADKNEVVFIKRPVYETKKIIITLSKNYIKSDILFDSTDKFYGDSKNKKPENKHLDDFPEEIILRINENGRPERGKSNKTIHKVRSEFKTIGNIKWDEYLCDILSDELGPKTHIEFQETGIKIQCSNVFEAHISNENKLNNLNIMGVISGNEYDTLKARPNLFKTKSKLKPTLIKGGNGTYNTIWHHSKIELESSSLERLQKSDFSIVIQTIFDFVVGLIEFKREY